MHINLFDEIGAYDLSGIFDESIKQYPALVDAGTTSDATASYVIGRYFAINLRDQLMVALAMGSRVVDISIHPFLAKPIAHYLHHRSAVEQEGRSMPPHEVLLQESIIECDLHNDPDVDPLSLVRILVNQTDKPDDIPRALARMTLDRIWNRLEAILAAGGNRIHLLVPANAADLSGNFRDAA